MLRNLMVVVRRLFGRGSSGKRTNSDLAAAAVVQHGNALEQHALRIDELTRTAETILHRLEGLERAQLELQRDVALRITRIAARLDDPHVG